MKTITNTISGAYTCDGCSGTAASPNSNPPAGWKSFQVLIQPIVPGNFAATNKNVDLCATCSHSGNSSGIAALGRLLS